MYIYPDNLQEKATLFLWQLRDVGVIGVAVLFSALALAELHLLAPLVATAVYAFLTIRFEDASILDFIKNAVRFFFATPQRYEWRMRT